MRNRIERLRLWLLGGAGLLVLILIGFVGLARYAKRHLLAGLPQKLGLHIKSMSDGPVSYSHSVGHTTVYTIHASRQVEYTDGRIMLRDVDMTLFGPKGDRSDRIYGKEFEYDQNSGVVRAVGQVHIDLKAAEAPSGEGKDTSAAAKRNGAAKIGRDIRPAADRVVHATTSGLVYMDKLGVAATSEPIEFQLGGLTGHAVGADYSTDSGTLILHNAVNLSGVQAGRPVTLTASTAELNHHDQRASLKHAKYVSGSETIDADLATFYTRTDGTLARIIAEGNVTSEAKGATLHAARADVLLNAQSQPETAALTGVTYAADEPMRQVRSWADAVDVRFDSQAKPRPKHATLTGAVRITERIRAASAPKEPWSVRELTAAKVETVLDRAATDAMQISDVDATEDARLTLTDNGSLAHARAAEKTELSADELKAHLVPAMDATHMRLDTVKGRGHSMLHQAVAGGLDQTSASDSLDAKFREGLAAGTTGSLVATASITRSWTGAGARAPNALVSAVQQGHVTIVRRIPAKPGAKPGSVAAREQVEHATADRAVYDGDMDRVMLSGAVQIADDGDVLWANHVTLDPATGDAWAEGLVKVNFVQDPPVAQGPAQRKPETDAVHLLADGAELNHATGVVTFHGLPARMWQGGSQVQAPVIELNRVERKMVARGEAEGSAGGIVHTILVNAGGPSPGATSRGGGLRKVAPGGPGPGKPPAATIRLKTDETPRATHPVRIASGRVTYSEGLRQVEFSEGVVLDSADGHMVARQAIAYLQSAAQGLPDAGRDAAGGPPNSSLSIERVIASGKVELSQAERKASGERLIYTAADHLYVMIGRPGAPPKVTDTGGTTVTGAAIQFHADDERVEAMNTAPGESVPEERVRTESRAPDQPKRDRP